MGFARFFLSLIFCFLYGLASFAQVFQQDHNGCSNEECYSASENLAAALGLLGAVVAPLWLVPKDSHHFLTKTNGEFIFGGLSPKSKLASFSLNFSDIPETSFGLKTALTLAVLKDGFPTNLRYELTPDYAFFKDLDTRFALGSGLAIEKFMEEKEFLLGVPLELRFQNTLSGSWGIEAMTGIYFLKQPVYRGTLQVLWSSIRKKDDWIDSTFGYQIEDNKIQKSVTHYLFVGVLI